MKRLLILALLFVSMFALAQEPVYYQSEAIVEWDPAGTAPDGSALLTGDTVEHDVYVWDVAGGDPATQPLSSLLYVGTTTETELFLEFPYRAEWAVVVDSTHVDGGGNRTRYDATLYSTVGEDTASGVPFVYAPQSGLVDPTRPPEPPAGLRDAGI